MPVAVRLIEVLSLVTIMGILTGFSIFVVVIQRVVYLSYYLLGPVIYIFSLLLRASEKLLIAILMSVLSVTHGIGNTVQG